MPERRPHRPTIKDVAARAGVSVGTVSQILHGKRSLHLPQTVEKVSDAVRVLGYRPNVVARSLARRRTRMIGVVLERYHGMLTRNVYCSHILDGVLDQAVEHRYQCSIIVLLNDAHAHAAASIETGTVDGVVLVAPAENSPLLDWVQESRFPAVAVGFQAPEGLGISCVDVDSFSSMRDGVARLIALGHRRIGFLRGPEFMQSARIRFDAYIAAMCDAGIAPCPEWIVPGTYQRGSGFEGAVRLMHADPDVTAIVASNDHVALGAMEALRRLELAVPERVSVLGFDDIEAASLAAPPLTTIQQPIQEIGHTAAELLIQQLESGKRSAERILFPGQFIERQSLAHVKEVRPARSSQIADFM